ncbi:hypothetical protein B0J14DRAFT_564749 [Halenospora varia]|nr:hypothetical protein B0J14DRAFT_564749 [Halenospora varia]
MASHTNATGPGLHFLGSALGDQLVTLFIGNKRRKFVVHKSLLHEDFFNKIFAAGASHGNTMHLPEEDPDAFSLFVDWIYRSNVPTSNDNARLHLRNLLGLYVLADKMSLSTLKDKVIDVVQETCSSNHLLDFIVEESFVAKAISILPLESQMYDFISWWLAYHIVSKAIEDHDIFDQGY